MFSYSKRFSPHSADNSKISSSTCRQRPASRPCVPGFQVFGFCRNSGGAIPPNSIVFKRILFFLVFALTVTGSFGEDLPWTTANQTDRDMIFEAVGSIQPRVLTTLSSQVTGNVLEVLKREGDSVKQGEVLVKIDARDLSSDLAGARAGLSEASSMMGELEKGLAAASAQKEQAEAGLKLAEVSFDRVKTLLDKKSVTRQEYDQAEAQVRSARAQAQAAQAQIETIQAKKQGVNARVGQAQAGISRVVTTKNLAEVISPFQGRVTSRKIEPGMLAAPGLPLMVIEDHSEFRLEAIIPEHLISQVTIGTKMQVQVDALAGQIFEGTVADIFPAGDVLSHTFNVKVALGADARLRSGMFGRGKLHVGTEKVLAVPRGAVESKGQLDGIYLERSGKPVYSLVRVGRDFGENVEIVSGLMEGEKFLAAPLKKGVSAVDGTPLKGESR